MPHTNTKVYTDTDNGYGISTTDVAVVLGSTSNDVGTLCTCASINMWSKRKPVRLPYLAPDRSGQWWKSQDGNCGISVANGYLGTLNDVAANDYQIVANTINGTDIENGWEYLKPRGGAYAEPYRLADFDNYLHTALPKYSGMQITDSGKWGTFVKMSLKTNRQTDGSEYEVSYADVFGDSRFEKAWMMLIWKDVTESTYVWQRADSSHLVKTGTEAMIGNTRQPLTNGHEYDVYAIMCIPNENTGTTPPDDTQLALAKYYTYPRVPKYRFTMQSKLTVQATAQVKDGGNFVRVTIKITNNSAVAQTINASRIMLRTRSRMNDYITAIQTGEGEKVTEKSGIEVGSNSTTYLMRADGWFFDDGKTGNDFIVLLQLDNDMYRDHVSILTVAEFVETI